MSWTKKDEVLGNTFIERNKDYVPGVPFLQRMNNVAHELFYNGYNDPRLSGVRSYIAHKASEAKKQKKEFETEKQKQLQQNYVDELLKSDQMQHGLHPEDEEFDPQWF